MSFNDDNVTYINSSIGWVTESLMEFSKKWNGAILMSQKQENSGEQNYRDNKRNVLINTFSKYSFFSVVAAIISIVLLRNMQNNIVNSSYTILFIAKIIGLASSIALLNLELGANSLIYKACSFHKKLSCLEVLHSSLAKVLNKYSLAEIGVLYFIVTLTELAISPYHFYNETRYFLFVLSTIACVFSLYLIYS